MRILVACEFSGIVREAFRKRGHDAWSCDLLPSEIEGQHFQADCIEAIASGGWDLMIAHPPCTHLASSGARWFKGRQQEQHKAIQFVQRLSVSGVRRIAIENPIGVLSTQWCKPTQIIQPWMFGHPETKATCMWLVGLPKLVPTNDVREEMAMLRPAERHRVHHASPGPDRWKERSRTLAGIADAMADQWGPILTP